MARKAKPDPQQYQLPLNCREPERLACLRNLRLEPSSPAAHIRYLLELVGGVAGDGELTWKVARIAERLSLPERSLRRTIAVAERCGLLQVRHLRRAGGAKDKLALRVAWEAIAAGEYDPCCTGTSRAAGRSGRDQADVPGAGAGDQAGEEGVADGDVRAAMVAAPDRPLWPRQTGHGGRSVLVPRVVPKKSPPPPPPARALSGQDGRTGWAAAAEILRERCSIWAALLDEARAAGWEPEAYLEHVRAAAAVYDANRRVFSGGGALAYFLRRGAWPAEVVDPEAAAAARRERAAAAQLQAARDQLAAMVREGRRAGLSDEEISARLRDRLPADVVAEEGWA